MRVSVLAVSLLSAVAVKAVDTLVKVGAGGLVFDPSSITAAEGDTVTFQWQPTGKNHSVTESTFAAPCTRQTIPTEGVDSGFMIAGANATELPQWTITIVNASAPLWFFCAQTAPVDHCGSGMVFAVNAPPSKTFEQFQNAAKATLNNSTSTATGAGTATTGGGASASGTGTAPATSTTANGALEIGGGAAGVMTAVALLVGLVL
ncbi:unnamed protein product [Cyclocybe aegerita]|uniref:Phytocyanin domain-containing protein n=1 Tax=Cyclocybe aegerita TaxID=1973307 RepID=A0A8S0W1B7_CYCAE|nr:unnamed protein product [Cyclocybe aegerita]